MDKTPLLRDALARAIGGLLVPWGAWEAAGDDEGDLRLDPHLADAILHALANDPEVWTAVGDALATTLYRIPGYPVSTLADVLREPAVIIGLFGEPDD